MCRLKRGPCPHTRRGSSVFLPSKVDAARRRDSAGATAHEGNIDQHANDDEDDDESGWGFDAVDAALGPV